MKKALSLVLALSLLLALALPAAAEEGAEARLSAVTLAVKETLDLDTDAYSDFSGYPGRMRWPRSGTLTGTAMGAASASPRGRTAASSATSDMTPPSIGTGASRIHPSQRAGGTGPKRPLRPSWTRSWPPMRPWCSGRTRGNP